MIKCLGGWGLKNWKDRIGSAENILMIKKQCILHPSTIVCTVLPRLKPHGGISKTKIPIYYPTLRFPTGILSKIGGGGEGGPS
jgi:hypothetical protein